jgi:peptidoglycan/LPS O-acetylase OafA/YrhL
VHAAVQYVFLAALTALGVKSQHDLSPALSIVLVASAVITSLFFADLAHRHIEVPAQKALRNRLSRKKRPAPQAAREWAQAH